jgi:hypothetical protein
MDCSCIAPLTPPVMVIRGFVFHPLLCMSLINGLYLACFCVMACYGNLSWQYMNSMNWIVFVCDGNRAVKAWLGTCIIHRMYGLSLAWHWHLVCGHVHSMSHSGTVCFWLLLLVFHAFVNV